FMSTVLPSSEACSGEAYCRRLVLTTPVPVPPVGRCPGWERAIASAAVDCRLPATAEAGAAAAEADRPEMLSAVAPGATGSLAAFLSAAEKSKSRALNPGVSALAMFDDST